MSEIQSIGGIDCLLELGPKWTLASLNSILSKTHCSNPSEKLFNLAQHFIGTPFEFESDLPVPPHHVLRVRLQSFDCVTFLYHLLAMCLAGDTEEYVKALKLIRYDIQHPLDPIQIGLPPVGNFFDFACESLFIRAVRMGFLENITEQVKGSASLQEISVSLLSFKRDASRDSKEEWVSPRYGERILSGHFIPSSQIPEIDVTLIRSGDIVLFTRGQVSKDGKKQSVLIGHLAIIQKENDQLYFIHSTRFFAWRPDANINTPPDFTGIYYDAEGKKEQIGVGVAGEFAGDHLTVRQNQDRFFGSHPSIKRTLANYSESIFKGVVFMRPTSTQWFEESKRTFEHR